MRRIFAIQLSCDKDITFRTIQCASKSQLVEARTAATFIPSDACHSIELAGGIGKSAEMNRILFARIDANSE